VDVDNLTFGEGVIGSGRNPGLFPKIQLLTQYKWGRFPDVSTEINFGQSHRRARNNRHERNRGRVTIIVCLLYRFSDSEKEYTLI
jgi:hypothetical protein